MLTTHLFDPKGFASNEEGFSFRTRLPYYRGIQLSVLREIKVSVDGVTYPREAIRLTVNGETFTQDEMLTVISNRWQFGQFATVTVLTPGGLTEGAHHIEEEICYAPSYMPFAPRRTATADFVIEGGNQG